MHKFFRKIQRYDKIEKLTILYIIVLGLLIFFLPLIEVKLTINGEAKIFNYYLINKNHFLFSLLIIFLFAFLLTWNLSFRFRKFIYYLVGFKENESLINLAILIDYLIILISFNYIIQLINTHLTSKITTKRWYYVLLIYLIIWIILNTILAINLSKRKKSSNFINITPAFKKENDKNYSYPKLFK